MGFLSNLARGLGLKSPKTPAGYDELAAQAALQARIGQALLKPNFGEYRGKFQAEEDAIRRSIAQGLSAIQTADARRRARTGRYGLLQDARRDETLARAGMQAYDQAKEQARARTRQYLMDAAGVSRGAASTFGAQAQISDALNQRAVQSSMLIPEFIASRAFPSAQERFYDAATTNLLTGGSRTPFNPGPINWHGAFGPPVNYQNIPFTEEIG